MEWKELTSARPSDEFFPFYETEEAGKTTPNLARSLEVFRQLDGLVEAVSALDAPRCLIQGYSCSSNARALHEFLEQTGVAGPRIHAIDIDDRGFRAAREKGLDRYLATFRQTNAADGRVPEASMDLVAQDFVLNCACLEYHEPILSSAAAALSKQGIALIGYTSCDGIESTDIPKLRKDDVERKYGISLSGVLSVKDRLKEELAGKAIECGNSTFILVTGAGDFEFYRSAEGFEQLLYKPFRSLGYVPETGVDRNGMVCYRRRELLVKR